MIDLAKFEILNRGWKSFLNFRDQRLEGMQTGIPSLDRILLGLSGIVIVQAAPGNSKSTLTLQVAWHQVMQGMPVFVFDRENGRERTRMRLLCLANHMSQVDVLTAERERLEQLINSVNNPLFRYTNMIKSPEQLSEIVASIYEKEQKRLFIVIDSIQKLPPLCDNERLSIDRWLLHLDQLKLQFDNNVVFMCTSEKSRGEGGRNYTEPTLSSAKGTGEIEFAAEQVLDLRARGNELLVRVMKNRDGLVGAEVKLQRCFVNSSDESSFCFRLKGE